LSRYPNIFGAKLEADGGVCRDFSTDPRLKVRT
jgi:hypothetical protein